MAVTAWRSRGARRLCGASFAVPAWELVGDSPPGGMNTRPAILLPSLACLLVVLLLGLLLGSCRRAGAAQGGQGGDAPAWVHDPYAYVASQVEHSASPGSELLAVGRAPLLGNPIAARRAAELDGRLQLLQLAEGSEVHSGVLTGSRALAFWVSPSGEVLALMSMPLP